MYSEPKRERPHTSLIVLALLLMISLTALDTTIISVAAPTIVGSLGSLSLFSWVFSIYLLCSTVTIPIFGRLSDIYGRKPLLLGGAATFLIGSVLCGASQSMAQLILFRGVQGIGAGAVMPVTMTVIGDLFPVESRAKIQGLTSGVWGVASVIGPTLGGFITDTLTWRWIFLMNLPMGFLAIALIVLCYHERTSREERRVDYLGAALLSGSMVSLLIGLTEGVTRYGWIGGQTLLLFGIAGVLLALFVKQENRVTDPILPLSLLGQRIIALTAIGSFLGGALIIGTDSYLPLFLQAVMGGSPTEAGLALAPMSVGWMVASYLAGKTIVRFGYAPGIFAGSLILVGGTAALVSLSSTSTWPTVIAYGVVLGLGFGLTTSCFIIAVQSAVGHNQRGVVTGSVMFFRSIGSSVSVAIMGAVLSSSMTAHLKGIDVPPGTSANDLLNKGVTSGLSSEMLATLKEALASSLSEVFLVMVAAAVLSLVVAVVYPRGRAKSLSLSSDEDVSEVGMFAD